MGNDCIEQITVNHSLSEGMTCSGMLNLTSLPQPNSPSREHPNYTTTKEKTGFSIQPLLRKL